MEEYKKKTLKGFLVLFTLALFHFTLFSLGSKLLDSGGTNTLSLWKTFVIFLLTGGKTFLIYLIIFGIGTLVTTVYFPKMINKRVGYFAGCVIIMSYIPAVLFLVRQSIYTPGYIESFILKGSIPFFSRKTLFFIHDYFSMMFIDSLLFSFFAGTIVLFILKYQKYYKFILSFFAIIAISFFLPEGKPQWSKEKVNILMLGVDSLRPDHLSINGYERKTTPYLDKILEKSIIFDNAYTVLPRTSPSLTSLFTGLNPNIHGIRHMFPKIEDRLIPFETLPRVLNKNKYSSFVISDYAGEFFDNVELGFQNKDVPKGFSYFSILSRNIIFQHPFAMTYFGGFLSKHLIPETLFLPILSLPNQLKAKIEKTLVKKSKKEKNFFLTAFFSSVHIPYTITYPFYNKWEDITEYGPNRFAFSKREIRDILDTQDNDKRNAEQIKLLYDRALYGTDQSIGALFSWLEKKDILNNTIILLFSDHGENLPEKGSIVEHGTYLTEKNEDSKIFLSLFLPSKIRKEFKITKKRIKENVRITDVMPTLLSLVKIRSNPTMGKNLIPLLQGNSKGLNDLPVFLENGLSFFPEKDYEKFNSLSYPNIFELIKMEDSFPYYFSVKDEYALDVFQAKWRKLITDNGVLQYIPRKSGALLKFSGTKNKDKLKELFEKFLLMEPATFINGNNNIEYGN